MGVAGMGQVASGRLHLGSCPALQGSRAGREAPSQSTQRWEKSGEGGVPRGEVGGFRRM